MSANQDSDIPRKNEDIVNVAQNGITDKEYDK
jgi:hypothetical protein